MIDYENQIFSRVKGKLTSEFTNLKVSGSLGLSPTTYPCVVFSEIDNYADRYTADTSSNENHVIVTYELNIYCNEKDVKKSQAKKIMKVADNELQLMGFVRNNMHSIYLNDGTSYRLISRYTAELGSDGKIYRR